MARLGRDPSAVGGVGQVVALLQLALRDLEWIGVHEQDGLAGAIGGPGPAARWSRGSCRRGPRAWPQAGSIACVPDPSMERFRQSVWSSTRSSCRAQTAVGVEGAGIAGCQGLLTGRLQAEDLGTVVSGWLVITAFLPELPARSTLPMTAVTPHGLLRQAGLGGSANARLA